MTLQEFFNSKEKLAIHCDTEEKAKTLLSAFDKMGKKRADVDSYLKNNCWDGYKENTCYSNYNEYCEERYYKEKRYRVIEFEDIDLGENNMKVKIRDMTISQKWKFCNRYPSCKDCPLYQRKIDSNIIIYNCAYNIATRGKEILSSQFLDQEYEIEKSILDIVEQKYLQKFIDLLPCKEIIIISKRGCPSLDCEKLYIFYKLEDNTFCDMWLPKFKINTMYKGMELNKDYTLEELGLKPKEK